MQIEIARSSAWGRVWLSFDSIKSGAAERGSPPARASENSFSVVFRLYSSRRDLIGSLESSSVYLFPFLRLRLRQIERLLLSSVGGASVCSPELFSLCRFRHFISFVINFPVNAEKFRPDAVDAAIYAQRRAAHARRPGC